MWSHNFSIIVLKCFVSIELYWILRSIEFIPLMPYTYPVPTTRCAENSCNSTISISAHDFDLLEHLMGLSLPPATPIHQFSAKLGQKFFRNPADKPNQKHNHFVRGKYTVVMRKPVNKENTNPS